MKYSPEQKDKSIRKNQSLHREEESKRKRIRSEFPVEVYFEEGFLIIESKINVYTEIDTVLHIGTKENEDYTLF